MSSASLGGTEGSSPSSSPASAASLTMAAPKYGTLVPNRIFVGGISPNTSEAELAQLFSGYGKVKATKIILDRGGVSKGYGFVTFETEEEAKRLQQEPECIVLKERKLNIAPAIKKQSYNRSVDGGSGSPPSVPSNTYYYPNAMGLPYQNGMAFYNTPAPAPGTALGPPTDPTTIYPAGVFGPQASTGHQAFTPLMYPCPAPSLFMPQQYPYSPLPYEQYYASATATGAHPYVYTTSSSQSNTSSGGNNSGNANNGTGATSPPTGPPPPLPSMSTTNFYSPGAPPPHHHPPVPVGPLPLQMDHLYCSFPTGPHPPPHASMGLTDQQVILYPSDSSCHQSSTSDSQAAQQEDSRSTSSLSEQPHGETSTASVSTTPLIPLMPVKFPSRYSNYHPIGIHSTNLQSSQTCMTDTDDCINNQMHCRAIVYHPGAVFLPHTHTTSFHNSIASDASLLQTLPSPSQQQSLDTSIRASNLISRDYCKTPTSGQNNYAKSQNHNMSYPYQSVFGKGHNRDFLTGNKYATVDSFNKSQTLSVTQSSRLPVHYKKSHNSGSSACYFTSKNTYAFSQNSQKSSANSCYPSKAVFSNQSYTSMCCAPQRNVNQSFEYAYNRNKSYSGCLEQGVYAKSTSYASTRRNSNYRHISVSNAHYDNSPDHTSGNYTNQIENNTTSASGAQDLHNIETSDKPTSPPPAPYSPMTRPLPNVSPPTSQVQFYGPAQSRYQLSMTPSQQQPQQQQQQQQQQQHAQRRYAAAPTLSSIRKSSEKYMSAGAQATVLRQQKYKVNGIIQTGGKVKDETLGGAGDAPPAVAKMPPTPPSTPRTHSVHVAGNDQNQLSETCHQIQALTL